MEHPAKEALRRFLGGTANQEENRQIVRHLLTRCPQCAAALRSVRRKPPGEPAGYDEALSRCAARVRELAGAHGGR